jgi:DNA-binding PadR family transcriptional regulator
MKASWPSENLLLGLLCVRPMHGYELAQTVRTDDALRSIWRIERSEVYFLLGKLLKSEYVEASGQERSKGPARTVFEPTAAGRAAFEVWLRTPEQYPRNLRTSLLARVYMALIYYPQTAVELIDAQEQYLKDWLDQQRQRTFANEVVALVYRLRAAQVEATLGALNDLRLLALCRVQT